jgi:hypothetical protein
MQRMGAVGVCAICTRYKDGANIGNARFKLINESIKAVLDLMVSNGNL